MATLTVDLNDVNDVQFGLAELERRALELTSHDGAADDDRAVFEQAVRDLLTTKTGRDLIVPFVRAFNDAATIEEIARAIDVDQGVDPIRKAHSLVAGLGRWETPRGIKVFETLGGRPQRFRMAGPVREMVERELQNAVVT
jgi:hypothetical protein